MLNVTAFHCDKTICICTFSEELFHKVVSSISHNGFMKKEKKNLLVLWVKDISVETLHIVLARIKSRPII